MTERTCGRRTPVGSSESLKVWPLADDGVAGVGAAVVANDEVVLVGEEIDDLALGLVAPLQADDTGAGHSTYPLRTADRAYAAQVCLNGWPGPLRN